MQRGRLMIKAKKHIVWRKKKELLVLLDTDSGCYYTLNPVGQDLWLMHIVESQPLDQIIEQIADKYDNPPKREQIQADCQKLIDDWKANELIEEST